ncbi:MULTISPECIES: Rv3235 family protein [Streptomyces]|uniref:Rv3235 family protein n=1 Tax=Streptomyces TaxID=1883 RepID=UPI0004D68B04|nr:MULTISPECIES: Rv3235 family protein [Streptomyces]
MDRIGTAGTGRRPTGPGRGRNGPPARRDPRGPAPTGAVPGTVARRRRERELLARYWFADRLLLTLSGQRPVHWMLGHTAGPAYEQLVRLAPRAPLAPPRTSVRGTRPVPVVGRCDEYRPRPGVIEAYARVLTGDRVRALAFRLEHGRDGRWRCSAVELGPEPGVPAARGGTGA